MEHVAIKNIGILTSSRADFGIYLPLIRELNKASWANVELIVFGTHVSAQHGYTLADIEKAGQKASFILETTPAGDTAFHIAEAIGNTQVKFANFWSEHNTHFDLVFCLGDRYEMFAAVMAGISFGVKFAHLHGGETTLGAIDNVFRHAISHASWCHFTSTQTYANKLMAMLDDTERIYNVGSISLDNLLEQPLQTIEEFYEQWGIQLSNPTILATIHPETVDVEVNSVITNSFMAAIQQVCSSGYQCIITLPNADTLGNTMRNSLLEGLKDNPKVFLKENLGVRSYFSAMKHCKLVVGNSSSGIIEAASFQKYVINIGNRQKGRLGSQNLIHVAGLATANELLQTIYQTIDLGSFTQENIYYQPNATKRIVALVAKELYA